jgi:predicted anti-sigma-YlaC factor YlaD
LNPQEFADWIGRIYATREEELNCEQTQSLLPAYVEARLDEKELDWIASDIDVHLKQCPDCRETYQGLCYVAGLEAEGDPALEAAVTGAVTSPQATNEMTPA